MDDLTTTDYETVHLGCCDCRLTMSRQWWKVRRETQRALWCPNCGDRHSFAESTADQLRRDLDRARQENARLEEEATLARREAADAEAMRRRVLTRIHAGVCPHCNRSFQHLAAHMRYKHPDPSAPLPPKRSRGRPRKTPLLIEGPMRSQT